MWQQTYLLLDCVVSWQSFLQLWLVSRSVAATQHLLLSLLMLAQCAGAAHFVCCNWADASCALRCVLCVLIWPTRSCNSGPEVASSACSGTSTYYWWCLLLVESPLPGSSGCIHPCEDLCIFMFLPFHFAIAVCTYCCEALHILCWGVTVMIMFCEERE